MTTPPSPAPAADPGLEALATAHDSVAAANQALANARTAVERLVAPGLQSPVIVRRLHDQMDQCAEELLDLQVLLAAVLYAAGEAHRG